MSVVASSVPRSFIMRRLHSLMGLWLFLFLCEHLLTNSQAALWLGENGQGFVSTVNAIHNLPYLEAIEVTLLGIPILIHMVWGVKYALTSKRNSGSSDGSAPSMKTRRNRAYTWQRITSWILLVCLIGHVVKFRFLDYPQTVSGPSATYYASPLDVDPGLYTLANRLKVTLYTSEDVLKKEQEIQSRSSERALVEVAKGFKNEPFDPIYGVKPEAFDNQKAILMQSAQNYEQDLAFVLKLKEQKIAGAQVLALSPDFGTASLLLVRQTFKSPIYVGIYTLFVLAAVFHACNGFWTFLLTWGWVLKMAAQRAWTTVAAVLMVILLFFGLAAIWGTYWINLRY